MINGFKIVNEKYERWYYYCLSVYKAGGRSDILPSFIGLGKLVQLQYVAIKISVKMLINQKRNNGGNFTSVKGSEGGKARAEIQKEEAKLRIDEYNSNPNKCKYCGNPIFAPYDKKLSETKIIKFCSRSCAAKFNNKGQIKNPKGVGSHSIIENYADNEIIEIFENSTSLRDFSNKLGYKSNLKYSN